MILQLLYIMSLINIVYFDHVSVFIVNYNNLDFFFFSIKIKVIELALVVFLQ